MDPIDSQGLTDQDDASTNNETIDADTYVQLKGGAAIRFNKTTDEFEIYAYDTVTRKVVSKLLAVHTEHKSAQPDSEQPEPWIILSDMQLVVELPTVDLAYKREILANREPRLMMTSIVKATSDFEVVMTPIDPPVKTNIVSRSRP